jgi:hypothetical protein
MPRQSSASRSFPVRSSDRLRPPPELTAAEKRIFTAIVLDKPPAHFHSSDMPLLCAYTRACVLEETLARQIAKEDKALLRWERACKVMTMLSMRLRLSPQSRSPTHPSRPNPNGARAPSLPNYYETMRLQSGDDA